MEVLAQDRLLASHDHARLTAILNGSAGTQLSPALLTTLQDLLDSADIVESPRWTADIVASEAPVSLRAEAGGPPYTVVLCYPPDSDPANGRVSVLSPLGLSLIGSRMGEWIEWSGPTGERYCVQVLPPDAAARGDR